MIFNVENNRWFSSQEIKRGPPSQNLGIAKHLARGQRSTKMRTTESRAINFGDFRLRTRLYLDIILIFLAIYLHRHIV